MNDKDELLNQLRDVTVPEASGIPAPGWGLLILLLALLLVAAWFYYRRWQSRLWQRQALGQLHDIRADLGSEPSGSLLSRCSQLARQVVLATDRREQVAALNGEQWLEKLDAICGQPEFTQGVGRLLLDQPYQKQPSLADQDFNALFDSMTVLIKSAPRYRAQTPLTGIASVSKKHSI